MELTSNIINVCKMNWLFGPIADKELRVSSRRKRYYWLRVIYVALLLFFACKAWVFSGMFYSGMDPAAYMSLIGIRICRNIGALQFFAAHIIALFLLSGILSEEINKRTLPILLTTPITSFQIVAGKIFSKLTQVFLLLCLSFPVLAIIRVFGGVPWNLIVYSTCITILGVLFSASVIVFLSTIFTKTHNVFIAACILIPLYYGFIFFVLVRYSIIDDNSYAMGTVLVINPFLMFYLCSLSFVDPTILTTGLPGQMSFLLLFICHIIFVLLTSLVLMLLSTWRIRRVALKQISGTRKKRARRFMAVFEFLIGILPRISRNRKIRDVRGAAVVWKEMHNSLFRSDIMRGREIYLILIAAIVIVYTLILSFYINGGPELFRIVIVIWVIGAYLVTAITPASSIVKEKETSSWQILLCTPMSDGEILWGKIAGVLRKSCIMWVVTLLFVALGSYVGSFGVAPVILSFIIIVGIVAFFTGTGVYFSVISRNVTMAVMIVTLLGSVVLFVPAAFLWAVLNGPIYYFDMYDLILATGIINPLGPLLMATDSIELAYVFYIVVFAFVNLFIGGMFVILAKKKMRKKIF